MKTVIVVGVVVSLHVMAAILVFVSPGCRTPGETPPARYVAPMPEPVTVTPVPERSEALPPIRPPVTPRPVETKPPAERIEYKEYVVRSGDVLSRIANRVDVSITEIMALNNLTDPDVVYQGQTLLLPPYARVNDLVERMDERPSPQARALPPDGLEHVVRSGEALSVIAQQYDVSMQAIMHANNITNPDLIRAGDKLIIPDAGRRTPAPVRDREPERDRERERVREPDAAAPSPPRETVLDDLDDIFTERDHRVQRDPSPSSDVDEEMRSLIEGSAGIVHVAAQGETLEDIAHMYGKRTVELQRYNALSSRHIMTGQSIRIPRD